MKCNKCLREFKELVWLCPDEIFICNECLRKEINKIIIGVVPPLFSPPHN